MPVDLNWLLEGRILYIQLTGVLTIDDIKDASQRGVDMLDPSMNLPVHTIHDSRNIIEPPKNVRALFEVSKAALQDPRLGWMINVSSQNQFLTYMITMMGKLTGSEFRFESSVSEALNFLQMVDQTLPDLTDLYRMYDQ